MAVIAWHSPRTGNRVFLYFLKSDVPDIGIMRLALRLGILNEGRHVR